MKIIIYGAGYVGLANALMLEKNNDVTLVEVNDSRFSKLKNRINYLDDNEIDSLLETSQIKIENNPDKAAAEKSDLVILALPTNYDEVERKFDVSLITEQLKKLNDEDTSKTVLIKSTLPVGFTKSASDEFKNLEIIFSPEFLREGMSYHDATNPSRIIIGKESGAEWIGELFADTAKNNPKVLYMNSAEAETVKLFANTYLAMRVAFVNELDNFAKDAEMNSKKIIEGVSSDPRIGSEYFRPSTGYGGYCLPKDSKQLRQEFEKRNIESSIIPAIIESNILRRKLIVERIKASNVKEISILGLGHKPGVNNYRNSQRLQIAKELEKNGIKVEVVDENYAGTKIGGFEIVKKISNDIILDDFIG